MLRIATLALHSGGRDGHAGAMTSTAPPVAGVALRGLVKTFRSSAGPVQAVRGVDIDIAPGETVALLGPNGAGKSTTIDMLLGLSTPDAGEVRVFGMTPSEAIAPRRDRRDAADRCGDRRADRPRARGDDGLAVPDAARRRRDARAGRHRRPRPADDQPPVGRPDPAGALRRGDGQQPGPARARRADGGDGRRGARAVLADDAPLRRRRQDRAVRHPLPRGGRRQRRPDHPDGPRPGGGRRTGHADQGDRRRPDAPRRPCPTPTLDGSASCHGVRTRRRPRRGHHAAAAATPTPPSAPCCATIPRCATWRSPAPGWRPRSSS